MAVRFDGAVPRFAVDFIKSKRLHPEFGSDVASEEHALAFMAAKAVEIDVLADIRDAAVRSLEEGGTLRQFQAELTPKLQALGWWGEKEVEDPATGEKRIAQLGSPYRLRTIYESNLRSARSAGQWDRAARNSATHPYAVYELGPSADHRPEHQAWAGTILPVDDPWWHSHWPPNGWGCKCRVRVISEAEARRLGGVTPRPEFHPESWTDPRTGVAREIDRGLDPEWSGNPGRDRSLALADALARSIDHAADFGDGALAREAVAGVLDSPLLERQLDPPPGQRLGPLPSAYIEPGARRAMELQGTQSTAAIRPGGSGIEATAAEIRSALPRLMLRYSAETAALAGGVLAVEAEIDGARWRVELATADNGAAYIQGLRRQ